MHTRSPGFRATAPMMSSDRIGRNYKLIAVAFLTVMTMYLFSGGLNAQGSDGDGLRGGHEQNAEVFVPGPKRPLNPPYGGKLVNLLVSSDKAESVVKASSTLPSLTLTPRQLCDIELLMNGGFSPLDRFMDQKMYLSVVNDLRLGPDAGNAVFPMPITLDVSEAFSEEVTVGDKIALRDAFYNLLGILTVTDKYRPDKVLEATKVLGTTDPTHPAVDYLMNTAGPIYLGGTIQGVRLPQHFDFNEFRLTPAEVRDRIEAMGWSQFVAFQTRNPMHRAHIELTRLAANQHNLGVLIHPVVGMTKPGDVEYSVRVRCYIAIKNSGSYYKKGGVDLSLLPLAMRMAGPREAVWHAIIRKNYGASHFIVGRDHAGCKSEITKEDFYGAYDAQVLVNKYKDEIGIEILDFPALVYIESLNAYVPADKAPKGEKPLSISGTKFREMMNAGDPIPEWFSHPDVIKILREVSPPLDQRGFALFFTGLSGSGKTTITSALVETLQSLYPTRQLTILDGDVVRTHLSKELGFSIQDRNTNIARVGWVAAEVVRHNGIAVCSAISPFEESRASSRRFVDATGGGFILIHISTTAEECAKRDVKGLYAKAQQGLIAMTGVSHPYEFPDAAELTIDAGVVPVEKSVDIIIQYLVYAGYFKADSLPDKYQDPLPKLKASGSLTEGVVDPASIQCKRKQSAHLGALIGWDDTEVATLKRLLASTSAVEDVSNEEIVKAVQDVVEGKGVGPLTGRTSGLTEAQTVEAAWTLHYARKRNFEPKKNKSLVLANPNLLPFARSMLRVDPCFTVNAVKIGTAGAAAKEAIKTALQAAGMSADDAKVNAFVTQYNADLDELKRLFPGRVAFAA